MAATTEPLQNVPLEDAIIAWRAFLGARVVTDPSTLYSYSSATFATHQKVLAVLKPAGASEVQRCLSIATRHRIPIYPVSTGKNWGYGSSVPVSDAVILDLSEMRGIENFHEELGYVSVEPGVTQEQLYSFLRDRHSRLWMDATGSSPTCSIIGNTLERGFGHTPYGEHVSYVCGFEVALPNGQILKTGFPHSSGIAAAPVYRWGVGPSLDGLFTQSNLGVVVKMTIWLMPAPEYFEAFFFSCEDEDGFAAIVDALRPLRMNGTLRSACHIANDYKVLQGIQQYPWDVTGGSVPLQPDQLRGLRQRLRFGAWNGSGGLYGTQAQVREARRLLRKALKGKVSRIHFLSEKLLGLAIRYQGFFRFFKGLDLRRTLTLLQPVFGLMRGVPTNQPMASAYWRKRQAPPENPDPDADRCGLLWFSPVAPAEGQHAQRLSTLARSILLKHGFEPCLSFTLLTDRALVGVISMTYDREVPGEDDRAAACFDELSTTLRKNGYVPYRLGITSMDFSSLDEASSDLLRAIKAQADPADILAPGRYQRSR